MESKNYELGSKVIMKKQHPCGTNEWEMDAFQLEDHIKIAYKSGF